jgi:predicted PurR-regulated permease PerM
MVKRFAIIALVLLAIATIAVPVYASLVPMSWGFPVLVQNNSITGFQSSSQAANDLETSNIAFPSSLSGIFGSAFPTIGQTSNQGALETNIGYGQQTSSTYFAYPFLSIGGSPIPSMGLL